MVVKTYYGEKQGTTHLEIFTEADDVSGRIVHRALRDQEAYDNWHLAYYMNDVLQCYQMREEGNLHFDHMPRKEKFLLVYLILVAAPELDRVTELGSSIYEMIDGLALVRDIVTAERVDLPALDLAGYKFSGIELSDLLTRAARRLHEDHVLDIVKSVDQLNGNPGLIYDRSVTNYIFENSRELAQFVNRGDIGFLNTFFSLGETFVSSRLGKQLVYFSLAETIQNLDKPLFHLFGNRAPGPASGEDLSLGNRVLEGFFLNCRPEVAAAFESLLDRHPGIVSYARKEDIRLKDAAMFLEG